MISGARIRRLASMSALCLSATFLHAPAAYAQHASPHQHGGAAGKAVELGTSAAFDRQGRLWAVSKEQAEDGSATLSLRRSSDMGKSWSAPEQVVQERVAARGDERPKIAFGPKGELYLLYTSPLAQSKNPHVGDIRFVRSTDGGKSFSDPVTVHANRDAIVHSFGTMVVDRKGHIYVAWIDSRDKDAARTEQKSYTGNALYYAVSTDGGKTFRGDYRIADHTCECCRVSLALDAQGRPSAMWRHVFEPNIRDHALAELAANGKPGAVKRVTFDDWRVDACPHHGPSVAFAADGTRHQVWFNGKEGDEGGAKYAAARRGGEPGQPVSLGGTQAAYADVAVRGKQVAVAWKEFDGESTVVRGRLSGDGGMSWQERKFAATAGDSDKPYLIPAPRGMTLVWRTRDEGIRVFPLAKD